MKNENNINKILIMGLPATGKTTFIAALWYQLLHADDNTLLKLEKLDGDNLYFNSISDSWNKFEPVDRTKTHNLFSKVLLLRNQTNNNLFQLMIPDISGEIFDRQFNNRTISKDYFDFVNNVNNIMLFIHPDKIKQSYNIDDLIDAFDDISTQQDETKQNDWSPQIAPTQVKLVELLQLYLLKCCDNLNLLIILSAWDTVEKLSTANCISPLEWTKTNLPLLWQYLESNNEFIKYSTIGVSAQGFDYDDNIDLKKIDFKKRVKVSFSNKETHDITECLTWFNMAVNE